MKIVIAAHTPIGAPLVVGSHHLAREFSNNGYDVFHYPLPASIRDLLKKNYMNFAEITSVFGSKRRKLGKNLEQVTNFSFLPKRCPSFLDTEKYLKLYSKQLISSKNITHCDILIIDHPYQAYTLFKYKAKLVIYRPTDIYCAENTSLPEISKYEELVLKYADAIVATSQITLDHFNKTYSREVFEKNGVPKARTVITNGVDLTRFKLLQIEKFQKPTAIYMGSIDLRFDIEMCLKLADAFPEVDFLIVGPTNKAITSTLLRPNIELYGHVDYLKLPELLNKCHVGLLLGNSHVFNKSRSPMKLYEYAACGLPVVCSYIEEVSNRGETFVKMYTNFDEAKELLQEALDNNSELSTNAVSAITQQSWNFKAKQYLEFCLGLK